jgi:hypothetical protein
MYKKLIVALVLAAAVFAIVVAVQPDEFRVERSTTVAAPAGAVFAQVNDFHNWQAWSPWAKLDPAAKATFDGPTAGTGAVFNWSGNDDIGEGRMTLTESRPSEFIRIKLDFLRPMEGTSNIEFGFRPAGDATKVTWAMNGRHTFIEKAFCLVLNLDRMVGRDFEKGLANLKAVVEKASAQEAAARP